MSQCGALFGPYTYLQSPDDQASDVKSRGLVTSTAGNGISIAFQTDKQNGVTIVGNMSDKARELPSFQLLFWVQFCCAPCPKR